MDTKEKEKPTMAPNKCAPVFGIRSALVGNHSQLLETVKAARKIIDAQRVEADRDRKLYREELVNLRIKITRLNANLLTLRGANKP